jgi:hypothetical protein
MTFITYFKDPAGRVATFERWNYKRIATVINSIEYLVNNDLYRACLRASGGPGVFTAETFKTTENGKTLPGVVSARAFTI